MKMYNPHFVDKLEAELHLPYMVVFLFLYIYFYFFIL